MTKGSVKLNSGILIVLALCVGLCGCKSRDDAQKSESVMEESIMPQTSEQESKEQNGKTKADEQKGSNQTANAQPTEKQPAVQEVDTDAGEDLDVVSRIQLTITGTSQEKSIQTIRGAGWKYFLTTTV